MSGEIPKVWFMPDQLEIKLRRDDGKFILEYRERFTYLPKEFVEEELARLKEVLRTLGMDRSEREGDWFKVTATVDGVEGKLFLVSSLITELIYWSIADTNTTPREALGVLHELVLMEIELIEKLNKALRFGGEKIVMKWDEETERVWRTLRERAKKDPGGEGVKK